MEDLLMGLGVIFPIFFVIVVGYVLKQVKIIDESFVSSSTTLIYYIAVPIKMFFDMKDSTVNSIDINYVIFLLLAILAMFLATWAIGAIFIKDGRKLSAFVHCAYRSNFLYIGMSIIEMVEVVDVMDSVLVALAFGVTFYNILGIILLTYYSGNKLSFKDFIMKILKNPIIVSVCLGLLAKAINFNFYVPLENGLKIISNICTPLSLILIGGSLTLTGIKEDKLIIFSSAFIKDVLGAIIVTPIAYFLGFTSGQILVTYLMFGTPCAVNCFIIGKQMGSDAELTSQIVTISFILAIVSCSVGMGMLKLIGVITY